MQTYCRHIILSFSLKKEFPCKTGCRSHPPDTSSPNVGMWKHSATWILNFQLHFHRGFPWGISYLCCSAGVILCVFAHLRWEYDAGALQIWCADLTIQPFLWFSVGIFQLQADGWVGCGQTGHTGGVSSCSSCCWLGGELECAWPELSEKCSGYPIGTRRLKRFGVSVSVFDILISNLLLVSPAVQCDLKSRLRCIQGDHQLIWIVAISLLTPRDLPHSSCVVAAESKDGQAHTVSQQMI